MKLDFWNKPNPARPVVICERCGRDMNSSSGCVPGCGSNLTYGNEPGWKLLKITPADECRDCGASVGELHHMSCTLEQCPIHHEQRAFCACNETEEEEVLANG
jgi:hypothetical protein